MKFKKILKEIKLSTIMYDSLFYILFFLGSFGWYRLYQYRLTKLNNLNLSYLYAAAVSEPNLEIIISDLKLAQDFLMITIGVLIILLLLQFISHSFFKYLVWCKEQNKKLHWINFMKFTGMNLLNIVLWSIPLIISLQLLQKHLQNMIASNTQFTVPYYHTTLIIIVIFFGVYFTTSCYKQITKTNKFFKSLHLGYKNAVIKVKHLMPVCLVIFIIAISPIIIRLHLISYIISSILFIAFGSFYRRYSTKF